MQTSLTTRIAFLFMAITLSAALLNALPAHADTIRLVADKWCPYNCTPNTNKPGYMIEIARAVFSKHGHTVKYDVLPWTRAVAETKYGRYEGVVGAIPTDAPGFIFPANETGYSRDGFYSKGGLWRYTGPQSLAGQHMGIAKGYSYGKKTDQLLKTPGLRLNTESGPTPVRKNLSKLAMGRIDIVLGDEAVVAHTLKRMHLGNLIRRVGSPDPGENVFIAFAPGNKKSTRYARMLSDGMHELRQSGQLKKILDKYGVKDWR